MTKTDGSKSIHAPEGQEARTADPVLAVLLAAGRVVERLPPKRRIECAIAGFGLSILIVAGMSDEAVRLAHTLLREPAPAIEA